MDDCCNIPGTKSDILTCPECQEKGKDVDIITLKALLMPSTLETIESQSSFAFCANHACQVVYFSDHQKFHKTDLKVRVYQKDEALEVPVCYCFGWTRERLTQAVQRGEEPAKNIGEQVQANRCGCEVNNPQGSCCLGNVTAYVRSRGKATI